MSFWKKFFVNLLERYRQRAQQNGPVATSRWLLVIHLRSQLLTPSQECSPYFFRFHRRETLSQRVVLDLVSGRSHLYGHESGLWLYTVAAGVVLGGKTRRKIDVCLTLLARPAKRARYSQCVFHWVQTVIYHSFRGIGFLREKAREQVVGGRCRRRPRWEE